VLLVQRVHELYLFQFGYVISGDFSKVGLKVNRLTWQSWQTTNLSEIDTSYLKV